MPLLAHEVGFREPRLNLVVDLFGGLQSKRVELVVRRKELDPGEPRAVEPARQHDVAINPAPPQRECGEAHTHLEGDSRLFRQNLYRS